MDQPGAMTPPVPPPAAPIVPPAAPSSPLPEMRHPGHGPLIAAVAAVVVLLGGGAAFAAYNGILPTPWTAKPPTADDIAAYVHSIKSARTQMTLTVKIEPREADVTPIDFSKDKTAAASAKTEGGTASSTDYPDLPTRSLTDSLPSNLDLTTTITSLSQTTGANKADADTQVSGTWKSNGLSAEFDLAAKRVGDTLYAQVNKLPIPFLDISPILGKWIQFPKGLTGAQDILSYQNPDTQVFAPKTSDAEKKKPDVSAEEDFRAVADQVWAQHAIAFGTPDGKAQANGKPAWHVPFTLDADKLQAALDAACANRGGKTHELLTDDACKPTTDAEKTDAKQLLAHLTGDVWIDKKSNVPVRVAVTEKVAFAGVKSLADKQVHATADLTLSDVNVPVTVQAPADAIGMDKGLRLLLGQSADAATLSDQKEIVTNLRSALKAYQEKNSAYPATLDGLMGTVPNTYQGPVIHIPSDQYTKQPFVYSTTGKDYALVYTIKLVPADDKNPFASFGNDQYVDGLNTATAFAASKEALSKKDTDGDGLNDYDEAAAGTSPYSKDTDGDGYTDKQEVDSHNDPLKNYKTGKVTPRTDANLLF